MILFILTILLTILFILTILTILTNKNVHFLDRLELYELIASNQTFYDRFQPHDFHARNINSIEDYMNKIKDEICYFTYGEKCYLKYCMYLADRRLRNIHLTGFDGEKAYRIQWKIGCVNGKKYEEGLPHTIRDTIILEKSYMSNYSVKVLVDILIHEKVHLYQKMYKEDTSLYLSTYFKEVGKRTKDKKIRVNPDTDDIIYQDMDTKLFYQLPYKHDIPRSINDGLSNFSIEHPLEKMAIDIENNKIL